MRATELKDMIYENKKFHELVGDKFEPIYDSIQLIKDTYAS